MRHVFAPSVPIEARNAVTVLLNVRASAPTPGVQVHAERQQGQHFGRVVKLDGWVRPAPDRRVVRAAQMASRTC
jgi:hypothetical protein